MEKILEHFFTAFKEKISSPFFRYFTISWILWNYKFVYFLAFQDEKIFFDVHKITKFDYLVNYNFFYNIWYYDLLFFLIFPILSALFFIYLFPKINIYFFKEYNKTTKKEDEEKYGYKKFIKEKDIELKKLEVAEKKEEVKVIKEEVKKTNFTRQKKSIENTKFDEWKKEFQNFKNTSSYTNFNDIIEIINFNSGYFTSSSVKKISTNIISYLLANQIITKFKEKPHLHGFTEKGEYFAKLFFEENK